VTAASLLTLEAVFARLPKPDDRPMEFVPWIRNRAKDVAFVNLSITSLPLYFQFLPRVHGSLGYRRTTLRVQEGTLEFRLKVQSSLSMNTSHVIALHMCTQYLMFNH
jgi:hypothetical protein